LRQLVQEPDSGAIRLIEMPAPMLGPGGVLVRTTHSVISVGTERTKLEFGRKTLLGKALERPHEVRKVLETAQREGVLSTVRKVRGRLAELSKLGYSLAGVVEAVGEDVRDLEVGQRVACAGAGYANHAERVFVPKNLVVPVPDGVSGEAAAFTTLGAIALHGVRQAEVVLGDAVVVLGLGILGQLTVQLLRAAGARPIGIDMNASRVELAEQAGALGLLRSADVENAVLQATSGAGADAVIITAATSSEDPIRLAGALARDRARVVVVGAVPMRIPRTPYFEKELDVRLSRSYGPGRYDPAYEEKGNDYPIGYVRWTERRNLAEFLRLVANGSVTFEPLITHRFPFEDAERAYAAISANGAAPLGVVLEYPATPAPEPRRIANPQGARRSGRPGRVGVGVIGAGNFATGTLLPLLKAMDVEFQGVLSGSGTTAVSAAERFGFRYTTGSVDELLEDPAVDAVVIASRHDAHAALAAAALRAGKAVFVEKPLAIDEESLDIVLGEATEAASPLLVGFNRRFAPATRFLRERLAGRPGARIVHVRVNAGPIPADSWLHDPAVGGGRLIGEGCHFIDLALHLIGSPPVEVSAVALAGPDPDAALQDNVHVSLRCADGSLASILYTSKGDPRSGKERVEVFAGGTTCILDDFRAAECWSGRRERWRGTQDKGHKAELEAFIGAVRRGEPSPIPLPEIEATSRATLLAARALREGRPQALR
jgi:predicted dehydrogenase/threonine dehydrogenase-like Zn-dependent dehydrogenase